MKLFFGLEAQQEEQGRLRDRIAVLEKAVTQSRTQSQTEPGFNLLKTQQPGFNSQLQSQTRPTEQNLALQQLHASEQQARLQLQKATENALRQQNEFQSRRIDEQNRRIEEQRGHILELRDVTQQLLARMNMQPMNMQVNQGGIAAMH
jgi:hypothetical protein